MKKANAVAFLGENTSFKGELSFHGTLRIDGQFKGQIYSEGTLIIGERGIVEADIDTHFVVISGEVHGNINAVYSTEINSKGKVYGSIVTSSLVIHEGVVFEGNCRMDHTRKLNLKQPSETTEDKKRLIKFFPSLKNKNIDETLNKPDNPEKRETG
ncbi:MAG: polymer-forming cytoskeletal protein [Desulfobacterales bacterium]